jgi:hypothetical protein
MSTPEGTEEFVTLRTACTACYGAVFRVDGERREHCESCRGTGVDRVRVPVRCLALWVGLQRMTVSEAEVFLAEERRRQEEAALAERKEAERVVTRETASLIMAELLRALREAKP